MEKYYYTSESVTEGHPDKIADQISDAVLDELIDRDPGSRVAVETLVTNGMVFMAGEVTSEATIDYNEVARETLKEIGYTEPEYGFTYDSCNISNSIHQQSSDIAQGVNSEDIGEQGAGDQGIMFGYAIDEAPELMPLPITLAHELSMNLAEARKKEVLPYLRPDGKSQVTVEYDDGEPKRAEAVVIAAQTEPDVERETLKKDVGEDVVKPVLGSYLDEDTKIFVNESGRFVKGGPPADSGLTGRKIIVDTYGGKGSHGGGCFSGKDPSKVDRSGTYMARYIAKNIVASGLADECEVQLSYALGVPEPVGVLIDTFGTSDLMHHEIKEIVQKEFVLKPGKIIKRLDLLRPIYRKTACYGHFGRNLPEFSWETTNRDLKKYF